MKNSWYPKEIREFKIFCNEQGIKLKKGQSLRNLLEELEKYQSLDAYKLNISGDIEKGLREHSLKGESLTTQDEITSLGNVMSLGNYPVGMSNCYIIGISGNCGQDCYALLNGECETEDEMWGGGWPIGADADLKEPIIFRCKACGEPIEQPHTFDNHQNCLCELPTFLGGEVA